MSNTRRRKRIFSYDEDSDSEFEPEAKTNKVFLHRPVKKKKVCIESDSDTELAQSEQNAQIVNEKSISASDDDTPQSKVSIVSKVKMQKVPTSFDSSDDEPLFVKSKMSGKNVKTNKKSKESDSGYGINGSDATSTSDEDKHLKSETTSKICMSCNSSDDELLAVKSSNLNTRKHFGNLSSLSKENGFETTSDEDEPLINITRTSNLKERVHNSSSSSDDEPLIVKSKKNSKSKCKKAKNYGFGSKENGLQTSSDEDVPITKIIEKSELKEKSKGLIASDDGHLVVKNRNSSKCLKINKKIVLDSASEDNKSEITSDEEKLLNAVIKSSKASENSKADTLTSSSEDEPAVVAKSKASKKIKSNKKDKKQKHQVGTNGHNTSDEEEPISKIINKSKSKGKPNEKHNSSNNSDDEPVATKEIVKQKFKVQENGDLSSDEDKLSSNRTKISTEKANKKKDKNSSNGKIEHLKKYLRIAGIHINSYDKFFENCKSVKSRTEKLLSVLHENGLKGQPSIEKCKKLKKKIETKKEIAELDISNIIKSEGRPKRGAHGKFVEKILNTESSPAVKKFSRLQDIIDSEESD